MRKLTLRSIWNHKRRLVSTVIAIVIGVGFICGTFVLGDTIDRAFDDLFADANEKIDAQVQGPVTFESPFGPDSRERLDQVAAAVVTQVDGVRAAAPYVLIQGGGANNIVLGADGDALGIAGPPTLLESWIPDETLNPYTVADGRGPEADNEMALNVDAADQGDLHVGDTVRVLTQFGESQYTLVGLLTFAGEDSVGGAVSADFTLTEAQRLAGVTNLVDTIIVAADDGISQQQLVDRLKTVVQAPYEVITGEEAARQTASDVKEGFSFFRIFLTVFAVIALIVGAFIIYNTFAILVAQRTRELALLRAVGASRRQIMLSVLLEAVVVGLVCSVAGLIVGVGLAVGGMTALSGSVDASVVIGPGTIMLAFIAGLVLTVLASLFPAWRATRVPPLAALREVAIDRSGASRVRMIVGIAVLLLGVLSVIQVFTADEGTDVGGNVAGAALGLLLGAIIIGPVVAAPSIRVIGGLVARFKGVTGRIAVENAARSPKRTSATAATLIIAVGLVGFLNIFSASAKAAITDQVDRGLTADLIVQAESSFTSTFSALPGGVADTIRNIDGVAVAAGVGFEQVRVAYPDGAGSTTYAAVADPTEVVQVLDPDMAVGTLTDLRSGGIIVDEEVAADHQISVGSSITVQGPQGAFLTLAVTAISDDPNVLGILTLTRQDFATISSQQVDFYVYVDVAEGADVATVQQSIKDAVADLPNVDVLDRDEFRDAIVGQITTVFTIFQVLLGISVIIAMIGIANTLSLSIHERTRELGLLRAVGMVRDQVRSAIRWESVLISVLGTLVGLVLALVLSRTVMEWQRGEGLTRYTVPVGSLAVVVVGAAVIGVLASILPSRRASKLNVLDAIAQE